MKLSRTVVWSSFTVLCVTMIVYRLAQRHLPPFYQGQHNMIVEAQAASPHSNAPKIGSCPVLPADSVWNTPVTSLSKDAKSEDYIDSIGPLKKMHADFSSNLGIGMPYTEIDPATRTVHLSFDYADDSDHGSYPIPQNVPIEGGNSSTGDRHVIIIDPSRCLLYELFDVHKVDESEWKAGLGAKFDMTSNALRVAGYGSGDAAGLPIFPGLVKYDEVASGQINHALRFTAPRTQNSFIWPARHKASKNADLRLPPMGARLRLRADFNISGFSASNQVILTALKKYGMFLADNGGALFISGVPDKRWNDDDLHKLGLVKAEDFEAVDESSLQLLPDSGRVDPVALKRH